MQAFKCMSNLKDTFFFTPFMEKNCPCMWCYMYMDLHFQNTFLSVCQYVYKAKVNCISFTEANLKRLRDINEEIQKLRMVNSQRGSREVLCDVVFPYVP